RADLELAEPPLARLVDRDVPRHDEVRVPRQVDLVGIEPTRAELVDLGEEDLGIDDDAGPDDAHLAGDDPARDQPDLERLAVDDDRVPGIGAALEAAHDVRLLREQVDDLALSLVAPLRPDDDGRRHVRQSSETAGRMP